jgi:excisionase family DNA binding protein
MEGIKKSTVVLTVEEAATVLRLSRNAAYAGIKRGEIPSIRVGRRILVPRPGLERLLGLDLPATGDLGDEDAESIRFEARRKLWRRGP